MKALLIDHDDSFTYNLRQWLRPLCDVQVISHRDLRGDSAAGMDLIVLSPGPKSPADYPRVLELIGGIPSATAIYGVCLGLQMLVHLSGGEIRPYTPPLHGKTSQLRMTAGPRHPLHEQAVARYHSLRCAGYESEFTLLAEAGDDASPLWLRHRRKKWMGVQFHPESFLTERPELHLRELELWLKDTPPESAPA